MLDSLLSIAPLFLLIGLGRLLFTLKVADANWVKVLNSYSLKLGFPALIFTAIYNSEKHISEYQDLFFFNSTFIILIFILGITILHKATDKRTYVLCLIFHNIAFLGIPILKRIYGEQTVSETGIIASIYLFWVFTLGVAYLEVSQSKKLGFHQLIVNLFKNPLLVAVLSGLLFQLLNIKLPHVIEESVSLIAQSVTPFVLLAIGIFTGTISFGKINELKPVLLFAVLTLFLAPLIFWSISQLTQTVLDLSIMEAAMPVAVTPFVMADQYNLNKKFIAQVVIVSTILSAITLPIWSKLI